MGTCPPTFFLTNIKKGRLPTHFEEASYDPAMYVIAELRETKLSSILHKINLKLHDVQGVLAARGIWGKEKTVSSKIREFQGLF